MMKVYKYILIFTSLLTSCGPGLVSKNIYNYCFGTNCCTGTNCGYINPFNQAYSYNGAATVSVTGLSQTFSNLTVEMFFQTTNNVIQTLFYLNTGNPGYFGVSMNSNGTMVISAPSGACNVAPATSTTASSFNDGVLRHMAATFTPTLGTLYINGASQITVVTTSWTSCTATALYVGNNSVPASWFTGVIDEVRLSNIIRYPGAFAAPGAPFASDGSTLDLFHFDASTTADYISGGGTYSPSGITMVPTPHP